jgi:hypothetical protein
VQRFLVQQKCIAATERFVPCNHQHVDMLLHKPLAAEENLCAAGASICTAAAHQQVL